MQSLEQHFQLQLKAHPAAVDYLRNRDIDGATAKRFGIGYAPPGWSHVLDKFGTSNEAIERLLATGMIIRKDNGKNYDRFRDRIMFPIRDARGRCIGFGGRVMGDDEPKYLNSPETVLFHKGRELYGLYEARQALRNIERLVVVEGYMDVVGLARHGIDFSAATLGTATTDDHLNRLFRLSEEIHFCFDGDRAGKAAAWKALTIALPQIREGRQIRFVFLPDNQDPDSFVREYGAAAFEKSLNESVPLSDFLIEELASQVDMGSVDGRARLAELAKPLVGKIPQGVYRELLTEQLAAKVGLSAQKLQALIAKGAPQRGRQASLSGGTRLGSVSNIHKSGKPSVVRHAITLLVHYPESGANLDVERLAGVNRPGVDLMRDLIETVQAEPNMTTARLLERWRNHDQGRHLGKLAAQEVPASDEFDPAAELADCLAQLAASGARDRIDFLIEKQKLNQLSETERSELRELGRGPTMSE
jgi:DNA primase